METDELIEHIIDELISLLEDQGFELTELQHAALRGHKREVVQLYAKECERKAMSQYAGDGSD